MGEGGEQKGAVRGAAWRGRGRNSQPGLGLPGGDMAYLFNFLSAYTDVCIPVAHEETEARHDSNVQLVQLQNLIWSALQSFCYVENYTEVRYAEK